MFGCNPAGVATLGILSAEMLGLETSSPPR
jgi:hypothetical protein